MFNSGSKVASFFGEEKWFKETLQLSGKTNWIETSKQGFGLNTDEAFGLARLFRNTTTNEKEWVLLITISTSLLNDSVKNINLGKDSKVSLVTENNVIVYDADKSIIGEKLNILKQTEAKKEIYSGQYEGEITGVQKLVAYHESQKTGWVLVGLIPTQELVKEAEKIRKNTFVIAVIAFVLALFIGLMVMRMLSRPLVILRNQMREGEQGNLRVSVDFRRKDEIGQLGESFNRMMEQITSLVGQTNHSADEVQATAQELLETSKNTEVSASEIAQATDEIAKGAFSLAVESEKGTELTADISKRTQNVIEANQQMAKVAAEVQWGCEQGTSHTSELIMKTNMTEIMTRSMVEKVKRLKDSTCSIRKILDVLTNMTKQTNILSLNATIEAARAGAAGKGFMVIADEIRKLADQSRQSIGIVSEITEKIQKEIDDTVEVLMNAYPIFQEQIVSVKLADTIFKQVQKQMVGFVAQLDVVTDSIDSLEHSQEILNSVMTNVSAVSEESSATSQEVASLSSEQLNVSQGLVRLSEKLENLSAALTQSLTKFRI